MINREDMLELTRRMTPARTSITRIAGCYIDRDGEFDGSFNTNFLKLSGSNRARNLKLAKTVPFSDTNKNLKKYEFVPEAQKTGSMWQLLMAMKECGLKNDALMDTFYDVVMERYHADLEYAVLVFHDRYDIPAKASDKERLGESEEVFEYLICVICPLSGEYEPGEPECGFLFPAFTDRCGDLNHVNVYQKNPARPHMELVREILEAEYIELNKKKGGGEMAYKPELWAEAKKKCRLNEEDIRMAKEMGLNPKSLIKNIPSPREQWKQPVKVWIREMYEEKCRKKKNKMVAR